MCIVVREYTEKQGAKYLIAQQLKSQFSFYGGGLERTLYGGLCEDWWFKAQRELE
jgi:hypothetical protein